MEGLERDSQAGVHREVNYPAIPGLLLEPPDGSCGFVCTVCDKLYGIQFIPSVCKKRLGNIKANDEKRCER